MNRGNPVVPLATFPAAQSGKATEDIDPPECPGEGETRAERAARNHRSCPSSDTQADRPEMRHPSGSMPCWGCLADLRTKRAPSPTSIRPGEAVHVPTAGVTPLAHPTHPRGGADAADRRVTRRTRRHLGGRSVR